MNLKALKFSPFESKSQAIIFDENGVVIASDNSLFEVQENVFNAIVLFQGMEDVIRSIQIGNDLRLNCINTTLGSHESHFDFYISKLDDNSNHYAIVIYDFAEQYQRVFELQLQRNIKDIESQKLERENRRVQEENEMINRLYDQMVQSEASEFVLLKSDNQLVNIDLDLVVYFEAYGDYIKVHTEDKLYVIYNRMKSIEESLPKGKFIRTHRSYIVPISKIKNIEQMSINVADKILPIGKQYKQEILKKMNQL